MNFYHSNDPKRPLKTHHWPFVYLHGEAENFNYAVAKARGFGWAAPDLFDCDEPKPEKEGVYDATLYGRPVKVYLSKVGSFMRGLAALADDPAGLDHASKEMTCGN